MAQDRKRRYKQKHGDGKLWTFELRKYISPVSGSKDYKDLKE